MTSVTLKVPPQIERLSNLSSSTYLNNHHSYPGVQYSTDTDPTPVPVGPSLPASASTLSGDIFGNFTPVSVQYGNNVVTKRAINPRDSEDMPAVRLVEGLSPLMGRLQVFYRDDWRSVCTNSRK